MYHLTNWILVQPSTNNLRWLFLSKVFFFSIVAVVQELLSVEGYERCVALLLFQLMDGLQHLHKEGAIHCNLTQDNLLIVPTMHPGGGDRLVISNFGDSIYYAGPPAQVSAC